MRISRFFSYTLLLSIILAGLIFRTWNIDSERVYPGLIRLVTSQPSVPATEEERKNLMIEQPLDTLPVVDNYRWNPFASTNSWYGIIWWWLIISILGWAAWPICFVLFHSLRDRGYLLSRTFGWLVSGWLLWLLISVGGALNTVINAWLTLLLLVVIGTNIAIWKWNDMRWFLRRNWGLLLFGEMLFAAAYLFFIYVRMGNPDLWQPWLGGEKFMEFAFLNGILRSPTFPPIDPHFAGGYINYYYFGIYLVAYLIKLTGIYAEVAFNLAIPTLFALTVVNAYSIAYSAVKQPYRTSEQSRTSSWTYGLVSATLGPMLVTIIGNLDGFAQIVRRFAERSTSSFKSTIPAIESLVHGVSGLNVTLTTGQDFPSYDFWGPSRVIPPTINEFPYWSFLFADLHPHMIGIPFSLLFLALVLVLFSEEKFSAFRILLVLPVASLLFGTMAVINLWDMPTYGGLSILAILVIQFVRYGHIKWLRTVGIIACYFLLAYAAYLPFFRHFTTVIVGGIGIVKQPDPLSLWLLIWGLFVFVLTSWAIVAAKQPLYSHRLEKHSLKPAGIERWLTLVFQQFDRLPRFLSLHRSLVQVPSFTYLCGTAVLPIMTALAGALLLLTDQTVVALCLIPLALSFLFLWKRGEHAESGSLYLALLAVTGWAILIGTQLIYLKDHLQGGDAYRMNTLFKFFNQVWVIWGIASAVAVPRIWQSFKSFAPPNDASNASTHRHRSVFWTGGLILLLIISLAFPVFGTPARLDVRFPGWRPAFGTLNGMDYMQNGVYTWQRDGKPMIEIELQYDYEAIQWLLQNIQGNVVIVEAAETFYYQSGGTRVASFTGLSGLNGLHEGEQRYGEEVGQRAAMHQEFWSTPDIARTYQILEELNISLIYVGQLERYLHPEGVEKIEKMSDEGIFTLIHSNKNVSIYSIDRLWK